VGDFEIGSRPARDFLLITCEHGGNRIPAPYRSLFRGAGKFLNSHRGFDAGALPMARELAAALEAPLVSSTVSRLLVDLNRSVGHSRFHFNAVRDAAPAVRAAIVERYYQPYRARAGQYVQRAVARGRRVIHVSSHSFTPVLDGAVRTADVGLLYDPARPGEVALCRRWQAALQALAPQLNVRRNYPYAGKGDGLTRELRRRYSPRAYIGIELEINQKHVTQPAHQFRAMRRAIIESLRLALAGC
jgi:predicted N-formylglutamate amidohydrolase